MAELVLRAVVIALLLASSATIAAPLAAPGDPLLRHDLQLLNDAGIINVPLTAWPISLASIDSAVEAGDLTEASPEEKAVFDRVRAKLRDELQAGVMRFESGIAGAVEPRLSLIHI